MQSLENYGNELKDKSLTANYVGRKYPNAMRVQIDGEDQFLDPSITVKNATGLTVKPIEGHIPMLMARPFVSLKRRANEENPVKVHSQKEYRLAIKHAALLINNLDCKDALSSLEKIFEMQESKTD